MSSKVCFEALWMSSGPTLDLPADVVKLPRFKAGAATCQSWPWHKLRLSSLATQSQDFQAGNGDCAANR